VRDEIVAPRGERGTVVEPEIVQVLDLEQAGRRAEDRFQAEQLAVRKDVAVHPRIAAVAVRADRVQQPQAAPVEQLAHDAHETPRIAAPDRLEHGDVRDLVEGPVATVAGDVAVIAGVDRDGQARAVLARERGLGARQRDRDHLAAIVLRRVARQ
jgi:hypothetical protein